MSAGRSRGGIDALLVAYVLVFALIGAMLGLIFLSRPGSGDAIDISRPGTHLATAPRPPTPVPSPTGSPVTTQPSTAPVAAITLPGAAPPPAAPPTPPPAPLPAAPSAAAPPPAPTPAPPLSAMPPVTANGFPPPPPEKPVPPPKSAAADPSPPAASPATAPATPAPTNDQVAAAPPTTPPPPAPGTPAAPTGPATPASSPPAATPATPTPVGPAPAGPLTENGPYGPIPRIGADGRLPWIVNNGRFDHRTRTPRIAVLLIGLGLDAKATEEAIVKLPPEISLGFLPYAPNLDRWTRLARDFGHEVLISLPLESDDPSTQQALGPRVLSASVTTAENLDRLRWIMSRAGGYTGLITWEGEKFLASDSASKPVLQEIANRGLMLVDSRMAKANTVQQLGLGMGLPFAKSRGFIDEPREAASIDANLATLEDLAKRNNFALAMAVAFPLSIERLVNWSRTVTQRGFVLAPVTGVTQCVEQCQARVQRHAAAVAALQKQ